MDLMTIIERFPTQESCIAHLEKIRWGDNPKCPHCGSDHVARKTVRGRVGRWNCHHKHCKSTFTVMSKTIFSSTKVDLQKWFLAISLVANAKKSLSSYQLARDLGLTQQTALYMQQRIRSEMASQEKGGALLQGIIEADEAYVGGKPRKPNKRDDDEPSPRGRGTKKTPVIGAAQRGGDVKAQVATDLTGKGILKFILGNVKPDGSKLMTDEFASYRAVRSKMEHNVVNHQEQFVDGDIHTNTIEGFWSLLKRAWYGSHHHYKFAPLYVAEACWKYNHRKTKNMFDVFLWGCFA